MPGLKMEMILEARRRIAPHVSRTPVLSSATLDRLSGAELFFKCENFQKTGSFKARGASNAVFSLSESQARHGVVTHSSGNHAAALARAAALRGIGSYIVMPANAPSAKQAAVRRYGGEILLCEPTLRAREQTARTLQQRTGAALVHPYNDLDVMAGQGTTALEFLGQRPELDVIVCPLGGGGHLSGIAVAAKSMRPGIRIIGAEPAGADDAARSLAAGTIVRVEHPRSIADGLLATVGELTFAEIGRHVDAVLTVGETAIAAAMRTIWEILKIVVEPSAAVGYAAIAEHRQRFAGLRVGVVLTGGNLDLDILPWPTRGRDADAR